MNMKNYIDVYIITSEHLKPRFASLNQQISKLKTILTSNDYKFNFHQINNPSHQDIEKNINDAITRSSTLFNENDTSQEKYLFRKAYLDNYMKTGKYDEAEQAAINAIEKK